MTATKNGTALGEVPGSHDSSDWLNRQHEEPGVLHRMEAYYIPLFREFCSDHGKDPSDVRILDCGCGNGVSVECLARAGFSAYGIDTWDVRLDHWKDRAAVPSMGLCLAEAMQLPFADGEFDIVMSAGLLEHIGVHEEWDPRYRVAPRDDQFEQRRLFVAECLRVLRRPGVLYIDHPNGLFPIDFWHDHLRFGGRPHWPWEKFLPSFGEIRRLLDSAGCRGRLEALSPAHRFLYKQIGRRWWGRAFSVPFEVYYRLMQVWPFTWLARTALNPYLVMRVELR